ncbi:hypothetical protein Ctob_002765 [Chrysochromulina tobinii]|uniref:EF-hand domain-containing protein n=1 Tax=Chrysochromulina tobinii TaxID=1460289 RepID=A0A0M0JE67_9EUKA|nr:hypothetical protein Ctob_002765 [Chrysochromulina tobinii]|eukprot:KOO24508.1 hypothetical protein Ctob_002765 [Chrysochromulina sp. CCMP291]
MVVAEDLQDAPDPGAVFDAILSSTSATDTRTISEIGDYLISQCTMKLALVPRVLRMIDANGDGIIDRGEFIKAHEAGIFVSKTVMILANVFAFELVMLSLLYSAPEPLPVDHVIGHPPVEAVPAAVINPAAIFFSACVVAAMCIPASVIFAGVFDPIIFLRVPKNRLWLTFCWPYWFVWMRLKGWLCPKRPKVTVSDAREAAAEQQVSSTIVESFVPDAPDDGAQLEVKGDPKPDSDSSELGFKIPEINGIMTNLGSLAVSNESINEGLLKASLTYSWGNKDWAAVKKILLSWTLSLSLFVIACFFFLLYGCQLFEPQEQQHQHQQQESDDGAGNPYELIYAWAISCFLRFLFLEPALILARKGLPMLFAWAG